MQVQKLFLCTSKLWWPHRRLLIDALQFFLSEKCSQFQPNRGLEFAVDSSQVVTATSNLDLLKVSADKLAESNDNLTTRVQKFLAVANDTGESTARCGANSRTPASRSMD
jgi:cell fate regulator YaaT (PSP1 superfamily)